MPCNNAISALTARQRRLLLLIDHDDFKDLDKDYKERIAPTELVQQLIDHGTFLKVLLLENIKSKTSGLVQIKLKLKKMTLSYKKKLSKLKILLIDGH